MLQGPNKLLTMEGWVREQEFIIVYFSVVGLVK